jgi:23S rRNA (cytidine1920-2'-O)/16S rRNA (cytidine1409-2'-O)-methyltransferase
VKERLDVLLVKKGLAISREKAKAFIMSGIVYVNGQKEDKPGSTFEENLPIEIKGNTLPYVSRGGLKLEKAIHSFQILLTDKICMDIGASTGGFTDCMLQNGAKKVYAVDSGRGQLDWKLRNDERVICLERTNARYLNEDIIPEEVDFFSVDVCFISLTKILEPAMSRLQPNGLAVCLIKPQFEAGKDKVGKKGVVRDAKVHLEVVEKILLYAKGIGFQILGLDYSPIKGPEGNIEYLLYIRKPQPNENYEHNFVNPQDIVTEAHKQLDK